MFQKKKTHTVTVTREVPSISYSYGIAYDYLMIILMAWLVVALGVFMSRVMQGLSVDWVLLGASLLLILLVLFGPILKDRRDSRKLLADMVEEVSPGHMLSKENLVAIRKSLKKGKTYPYKYKRDNVIVVAYFYVTQDWSSYALQWTTVTQKQSNQSTSKAYSERTSSTPDAYQEMLKQQAERVQDILDRVRLARLTVTQEYKVDRVEADLGQVWAAYENHLRILRTNRAVEAEAKLHAQLGALEKKASKLLDQAQKSILDEMDVHHDYVNSASV